MNRTLSPRVSIVVPLHDAGATIEATLDAVLAQTERNWELVVVDDASADGGPAAVEAWIDLHGRGRLLATPGPGPAGPSAARNLGLAATVAPTVAFLDADDRWHPDLLARRLAVLADHPGVALVWGPARYWYPEDPGLDFDQPHRLARDRVTVFAPGAPLVRWVEDLRSTPCPSATVFDRSALASVGGWPDDLVRGEDIATCLLVAARHRTAHDPAVLVDYRRHAASATSRANATGERAAEDLAFGRWLVGASRERPELGRLRRLGPRVLHRIAHRGAADRGPFAGRREITRAVLATPGARTRVGAVGLDWLLPLPVARKVAARLQRPVGDDGQRRE